MWKQVGHVHKIRRRTVEKIIQNLNMQMSWTDPGGVEDPERGIRALVVRLVIEELDRKSSGGDVSHNQRRQVQRERERE